MSLTQLTDSLNIIQGLADRPNATDGLTAAQLKEKFDEAANLIKTYINETLLVELQKTADGSSGADNIGATAITGLTGTTAQALLESIVTVLKGTTDNSSGADFIGATTVSGITGNTVQAVLEALKTYIDDAAGGIEGDYVSKDELTNTRKLDETGNFTGSWFGFDTPTASDPGIQMQVDSNTAQLADLASIVSPLLADGVTDCLSAFNTAKTNAGTNGTVKFPQNSTGDAVYYFSSNPIMTGLNIDSDDGVILSFPSTNGVNFGSTTFKKDIKITSRDRNNTGIQLNVDSNEWIAPLVAGDMLRQSGMQNAIALDATIFEKKQYNTANDSIGSGVAALTSNRQVDWALNAIGTTNAGVVDVVQTVAEIGNEYLSSFKSSANALNGRGGILLNSGGEWAYFSLNVGATKAWFLGEKKSGIAWSEISGTTPSGAYTIQGAAQPIISVRIVSPTEAEFYVNGILMVRYETNGGYIQTVGFGWNGSVNAVASLTLFNFIKGDTPAKSTGKNLKLSIYGDSISFGEGSNLPWTDLLKYSLRGLNAIASLSITNNAASGEKAAQQLSRLETNGVVGFDYTLVMVGTNDIQGQTAYETYRQNLIDMITKIKDDGSVPILAVPPMFIDSNSTGYGFNTQNYGQGGIYRAIVLQVCAEQGITVADVMTDFGRIDDTNVQLRDNIHPQPFADTFIARSFARAILLLEKGKEVIILPTAHKEGKNTIIWASSMPSSGSWTKGDIIYNTNVSVLGTAGSQYSVLGWRRLTVGYTNVLNTDWVEMRQLTGT